MIETSSSLQEQMNNSFNKHRILGDQNLINQFENDNNNDQVAMELEEIISQKTSNDFCTQTQLMNQTSNLSDRNVPLNETQNNNKQCSFIQIHQEIEKILNTPKHFLLAGGLVVELDSSINEGDYEVFIKSRSSILPEKFNDGSISINYEICEALHNFDYVIHVLKSTQNQEDYNLSLQISQMQQPMIELKEQIEKVLMYYDEIQMSRIINYRKKYLHQIQQDFIKQLQTEDSFSTLISYTVDWKLKSMSSSNLFITQPMLALFGTNAEEFIHHVLRKNITWILTSESRKKIMTKNLELFTSNNGVDSFQIHDFEIRMIDNIVIKCTCTFKILNIIYPKDLNFKGISNDTINYVDSISIIQFDITQDHLEQILKVRENIMLNKNNKQFLYCQDFDEYVIDNFEYYMQCQIFINKFYNIDTNSKISQSQDNIFIKKQRCKFKSIVQKQ